MLPGCGAGVETLFAKDGEEVPVGCNVCIERDSQVTLNCTSAQGVMLMYLWENGDGIELSRMELLMVSMEGEYTCTVTSPDAPDGVNETTNVFCEYQLLLEATDYSTPQKINA